MIYAGIFESVIGKVYIGTLLITLFLLYPMVFYSLNPPLIPPKEGNIVCFFPPLEGLRQG